MSFVAFDIFYQQAVNWFKKRFPQRNTWNIWKIYQ